MTGGWLGAGWLGCWLAGLLVGPASVAALPGCRRPHCRLLRLPLLPRSATVCPKGLNPGKAIAKVKQIVETGKVV